MVFLSQLFSPEINTISEGDIPFPALARQASIKINTLYISLFENIYSLNDKIEIKSFTLFGYDMYNDGLLRRPPILYPTRIFLT